MVDAQENNLLLNRSKSHIKPKRKRKTVLSDSEDNEGDGCKIPSTDQGSGGKQVPPLAQHQGYEHCHSLIGGPCQKNQGPPASDGRNSIKLNSDDIWTVPDLDDSTIVPYRGKRIERPSKFKKPFTNEPVTGLTHSHGSNKPPKDDHQRSAQDDFICDQGTTIHSRTPRQATKAPIPSSADHPIIIVDDALDIKEEPPSYSMIGGTTLQVIDSLNKDRYPTPIPLASCVGRTSDGLFVACINARGLSGNKVDYINVHFTWSAKKISLQRSDAYSWDYFRKMIRKGWEAQAEAFQKSEDGCEIGMELHIVQ